MPSDQDLADAFVAGAKAMRAECMKLCEAFADLGRAQATRLEMNSHPHGAAEMRARARGALGSVIEMAELPIPTPTLKGSRPDAE